MPSTLPSGSAVGSSTGTDSTGPSDSGKDTREEVTQDDRGDYYHPAIVEIKV